MGCTDALNLDGGGSSTLWARGQVMNTPCEGSERPMGNALLITLEPRAGQSR
jgi:exopolysaccharide biosynthesis protein